MKVTLAPLSLAALLPFAWTGCGDTPAEAPLPAAQEVLADSVLLAPGDVVIVDILRLTFLGVSSDSRCPVDAMCVWEGNAAVDISVGLGREASYPKTLNSSEAYPHVDVNGFRVTLLDVLPAPYAGVPIAPEDYRARFRVEALADST